MADVYQALADVVRLQREADGEGNRRESGGGHRAGEIGYEDEPPTPRGPCQVTPGRRSGSASGTRVNTSVKRSKPRRTVQTPTGNRSARTKKLPVLTAAVTEKEAARSPVAST